MSHRRWISRRGQGHRALRINGEGGGADGKGHRSIKVWIKHRYSSGAERRALQQWDQLKAAKGRWVPWAAEAKNA